MSKLAKKVAVICYEEIPLKCLHCEGTLAEESHSFLMINQEGEGIICDNKAHLCQGCPAAYLPDSQFHKTAKLFEYDPYAVVGFIDLELWPEEKRVLPIEPDENGDLPLVEFERIEALQPAQVNLSTIDRLAGFE